MPKECDQLEVIEEEMPTICDSITLDKDGAWTLADDIVVPTGIKMVLKKAGLYANFGNGELYIKEWKPSNGSWVGGRSWSVKNGASLEIDAEIAAGNKIETELRNHGGRRKTGGWFMFDFVHV